MSECVICQFESVPGDCEGNVDRLLDMLRTAGQQAACYAVISGNPIGGLTTEMLANRPDFQRAERCAMSRLAKSAPLQCVFSYSGGLAWIRDGQWQAFHNGSVVSSSDGSIGIVSGIDALESSLECFTRSGVRHVFVSATESFARGKISMLEERLSDCARRLKSTIVVANAVGLGEPFVYAGASVVVDASGKVICRTALFETGCSVVSQVDVSAIHNLPNDMDVIRSALTYAIRTYVQQSGFVDVQLGLSGGVDSALVATLAVDALGAEHVHALMMPTQYTEDLSLTEAERLAKNLGIDYAVRPIGPLFESFRSELKQDFENRQWDTTEENLQARIRGMLLMAHSNKFRRLVLATSNKSEAAVGYSTLYGDTAGAFEPIIDLFKTDVWTLCRHINETDGWERIPASIIDRVPSAELRPGQRDQDSLPDYAILDAILAAWIEDNRSVAEICAMGHPRDLVERIIGMVHRAEFKRRQCPMGPVISKRGLSDAAMRLPMTTSSYWKAN